MKKPKMAPSAKPENITSFFSLPRELRDEVYNELWKNKPAFNVSFGPYSFKIYYFIETEAELRKPAQMNGGKRGWRSIVLNPLWIYANGQLLQEAIEQFQRQCTWTSDVIAPDQQRHALLTTSTILANYKKSKFMLSPWKARVLRVDKQQLQELHELDLYGNGRSFISRIDLFDIGVPCLKFLHATIPGNPQLKRLELEMTISTYSTEQDGKASTKIDLEALKALRVPTLRSVGLTVGFTSPSAGSEEGTALYGKLREEFTALGLGLIGDVGKEKITVVARPNPLGPLWTLELTRS